jgi:hypothetical protein
VLDVTKILCFIKGRVKPLALAMGSVNVVRRYERGRKPELCRSVYCVFNPNWLGIVTSQLRQTPLLVNLGSGWQRQPKSLKMEFYKMQKIITAAIAAVLATSAQAWDVTESIDRFTGEVKLSALLRSTEQQGEKPVTLMFRCLPKGVATYVLTTGVLDTNRFTTPIRLKIKNRQASSYDALTLFNGSVVVINGESVYNTALEPDFEMILQLSYYRSGPVVYDFKDADNTKLKEFFDKCKTGK